MLGTQAHDFGRQTGRFIAKNEVVSVLELDLKVRLVCMGAQEPATTFRLLEVALPIRIPLEVHLRPVVQSSSLEVLVSDFKTQGLDQVKLTGCGSGESTNVASVVGNLGVNQDDVKHAELFGISFRSPP